MFMASNKPTSHHHVKAFHALVLFVTLFLVKRAGATQFKVGGASGWTVPSDANALNQWAEGKRFRIGDSLLFSYQPDKDSVLQVNKEDYDNCNVESHIQVYTDGNTIFTFDKSGPYFFISGVKDNCLKNEKLVVIVMADRRSNTTTALSPSVSPSSHDANVTFPPPPSNSTYFASPPSPSASGSPGSIPSLAPAGEESPPPPPPGNGASSKFISLIGCLGVLGSSLLLVL